MRHTKTLLMILLGALLVLATCTSCKRLKPAQDYTAELDTVYLLGIGDVVGIDVNVSGVGTGVAIGIKGSRTLLLTAAHGCMRDNGHDLLDTPDVIMAGNIDGEVAYATLVAVDVEADLCVISIPGEHPILPIATADPAFGADVYYIGAPLGRYPMLLKGNMASADPDGIVVSLPTAVGMSGGPIIERGSMVGMVVAVRKDYHHLTYAASRTSIVNILEYALGLPNE